MSVKGERCFDVSLIDLISRIQLFDKVYFDANFSLSLLLLQINLILN